MTLPPTRLVSPDKREDDPDASIRPLSLDDFTGQKAARKNLSALSLDDRRKLCRLHKLATADAIIYATGLERQSEIVTCDAHFKGLGGVVYFAKERTK